MRNPKNVRMLCIHSSSWSFFRYLIDKKNNSSLLLRGKSFAVLIFKRDISPQYLRATRIYRRSQRQSTLISTPDHIKIHVEQTIVIYKFPRKFKKLSSLCNIFEQARISVRACRTRKNSSEKKASLKMVTKFSKIKIITILARR